MGITFNTYCRKCMVEAPEMGDFGFVGAPTLGPAKKRGGPAPFGVIHDGFAALRMITTDLDHFKAFLDAHGRHPLVQVSDLDEEDFGDDDDGEAETPRPKGLKRFRYKGRHAEGFYDLACTKCGEAFRSANAEPFVPFEEFSPSAAEIKRFRDNVVGASEESFYKVGGFPYDDIDAIDTFLKAHRGHPLRGRLERASRPKRPRAAEQFAVQEWTPPEWKIEDHERYLEPVSASALAALLGLNHRDAARRVQACDALRTLAEPGALGYLADRADDVADEVRVAAARAAGALRDPRTVRALGRFLLDHSEAVRAAAREALAAQGVDEDAATGEARALRGPYAVWRPEVPTTKATREAVERAIRDPVSGSFDVKEILARKKAEPWARELTFVFAVAPSRVDRGDAADLLADVDDPRARPFLLALLEDTQPGVAADAAEALGKAKAREAVPGLLAALALGDWRLTTDVKRALVEIADPAAFDGLVSLLGSRSPDVRAAAASALAALRDPRAAASIAPLLDAAEGDVREAAATALGTVGGPEAASALARLATSVREADRRQAAWALGEMVPDPAAVEGLAALLADGEVWVRETAIHALGRGQDDPRVHELLAATAREGNTKVAAAAWRVLIREGGARAEKALVRAVDRDSSDEMIRDYLSSGNAALAAEARRVRKGRKLPARDSGLRWGEGPLR